MTRSRVAALLLDLDGTLVDSEPLHRERYGEWFARRGWPYDDDVASLFTGRRADDVFRTVDGPWSGEDPQALLAEIFALGPLRRLPEPVPGAGEAVAWARAHGIRLALVTSAGTGWVDRVLGAVGGADAFDTMVTREDVANGKPDPTCYALACERLGVDPATALACEDAPDGVRSAAAAGVGMVVGVTTSFAEQALLDAGARRLLPDLRALPELLAG